MQKIPEKDWKKMRDMQPQMLDIACRRILDRAVNIATQNEKGAHQTYLRLYKLVRNEDEKIGEMFDELKRSNAIFKLVSWYKYKLIDKEILAQFSKETQNAVFTLSEI